MSVHVSPPQSRHCEPSVSSQTRKALLVQICAPIPYSSECVLPGSLDDSPRPFLADDWHANITRSRPSSPATLRAVPKQHTFLPSRAINHLSTGRLSSLITCESERELREACDNNLELIGNPGVSPTSTQLVPLRFHHTLNMHNSDNGVASARSLKQRTTPTRSSPSTSRRTPIYRPIRMPAANDTLALCTPTPSIGSPGSSSLFVSVVGPRGSVASRSWLLQTS